MTVPQNQLQVNHPFKLLPSKNPSPNSASASHFLAQQMSLLHNSLLRTLNLIYNQAPHISSAADTRPFLALIKHWHDELQQHLKIEEEIFFPLLEKATGVKGIMENIVDERFYFEIGVEALGRYAVETDVQGYDGFEVQALIDDFGKMLIEHFAEEVEALEGLGGCDDGKLRRAWEGTREFVRRSGGSVICATSYADARHQREL